VDIFQIFLFGAFVDVIGIFLIYFDGENLSFFTDSFGCARRKPTGTRADVGD
jgi:hypothetical protein